MINSLLLSTVLNSTLIFSGQAIDQASTIVALNRCPGCSESNPLMRNPAVIYPARIGFALFGVAITLFVVPAIIAHHNLKVSK
jgi:hypothetical protein